MESHPAPVICEVLGHLPHDLLLPMLGAVQVGDARQGGKIVEGGWICWGIDV